MFADLFKSKISGYASTSKHDEVEEFFLPSEPQNSSPNSAGCFRTRTLIISHAATFLAAVLLSVAVLLTNSPFSHHSTTEPRTRHLHCGNTTAEARAQGCVFDALTNAWVPELCWDKEGAEEYMRTAPWQGYDMPDGKQVLTLEEMSERTGLHRELHKPYWTQEREHVLHCALMWQRQHRGYISGESKKLDYHALSYAHTVHCSESLVHMAGAGATPPNPLDMVAVRQWAGFSECDIEI